MFGWRWSSQTSWKQTKFLIELPLAPSEQDRPHVTMLAPFVTKGVSYELLHVRTAGIDVYSTHEPATFGL